MSHFEQRSLGDAAEVRAEQRDGKPVITGYAAVFNSRSVVMRTAKGKPFVETIAPGTFAKSLTEADVRSFYNHNPGQVLGRVSAGTLRVWEDERGLRYEVTPPDTAYARDLLELMRRGDVSGSSFTFATTDDDWKPGEGGVAVRELRGAHLMEVGPVSVPAYPAATANVRSLPSLDEALEALEARAAAPEGPPAVTYPTPAQRALIHKLRLIGLA